MQVGGKTVRAHRASYKFYRGPIPDGLWVLHRCDVRCCINPDHLWLGTHQDNVDDMMAKGRKPIGPRPLTRGTTFDKKRRKWVAQKLVNRRRYYFGAFPSEEEAHAAFLAGAARIAS